MSCTDWQIQINESCVCPPLFALTGDNCQETSDESIHDIVLWSSAMTTTIVILFVTLISVWINSDVYIKKANDKISKMLFIAFYTIGILGLFSWQLIGLLHVAFQYVSYDGFTLALQFGSMLSLFRYIAPIMLYLKWRDIYDNPALFKNPLSDRIKKIFQYGVITTMCLASIVHFIAIALNLNLTSISVFLLLSIIQTILYVNLFIKSNMSISMLRTLTNKQKGMFIRARRAVHIARTLVFFGSLQIMILIFGLIMFQIQHTIGLSIFIHLIGLVTSLPFFVVVLLFSNNQMKYRGNIEVSREISELMS